MNEEILVLKDKRTKVDLNEFKNILNEGLDRNFLI